MFLLIVISIIVFLIKNKTRNRFALFSFFWFFITLLPVSGIIPINSVIAEHYLYLTSVSFFLLFAYLCHLLWKKYHSSSYQPLLIFSLVFVFISLFSRTFLRNFDWKDPITFYSKSLAQSPWHVPMRHNLAMAYAQQGKFDIAVKEYQILIRQSDVYPQTHHNLANVYKTIGRYQEAEAEYLKALQMDQKFFFSLYGLADLYKITGEKEKLEEITQKLKLLQK
jgi:tetratricopeptide (TPR) repeat protein